MNENTILTSATSRKERIISFFWQHFLLLISLFVMTFGVSLCVRSNLGSSVISSLPLALSLAGDEGAAPRLSLGMYTNVLNVLLVTTQIIIFGRRFPLIQLLQLAVSVVFGALIDLNMALTATIDCTTLPMQTLVQVLGCTVMGFGIAMEVRCGSVTMAGEGVPVAINKVYGIPFAKAKIGVDISLVVLAVTACFIFFGSWLWNVVGVGTLFAMFYVGFTVKLFGSHIGWFEHLLHYRPGFRRYLYGLARYLPHNRM